MVAVGVVHPLYIWVMWIIYDINTVLSPYLNVTIGCKRRHELGDYELWMIVHLFAALLLGLWPRVIIIKAAQWYGGWVVYFACSCIYVFICDGKVKWKKDEVVIYIMCFILWALFLTSGALLICTGTLGFPWMAGVAPLCVVLCIVSCVLMVLYPPGRFYSVMII